jgi:hypothetical protein
MDRTADRKALSDSAFEGWNIGAVSVKGVLLHERGAIDADIRRHRGAPASMVRRKLDHGSESPDVGCEGHRRVSLNDYTEAPITIGPYATLLAFGAFDRYVNIGASDCAPANAASAVIHPISLRIDTPQAIIESVCGSLRLLPRIATAGEISLYETLWT